MNDEPAFTDREIRALEWLPADGSWRDTNGSVSMSGSLEALGRYHQVDGALLCMPYSMPRDKEKHTMSLSKDYWEVQPKPHDDSLDPDWPAKRFLTMALDRDNPQGGWYALAYAVMLVTMQFEVDR